MDEKNVLSHLLNMKEHHVCVYGCGENGKTVISFLKNIGITIEAVCDKKAEIEIKDCKIVSYEELRNLSKSMICIVTPAKGAEIEKRELANHFYKVLGMEDFRECLKYIPQKNENWNFNNYNPFNHYESPYLNENSKEYEYYKKSKKNRIKSINFDEEKQVKLLKDIGLYGQDFYQDLSNKNIFSRYKLNNGMFDEPDAIVYYSFLRKFKPKQIVEIGSGYSTALALDVQEHYIKDLKISCIEPFPDRLLKNIKIDDEVHLKRKYVQEIDLKFFDILEENDVLFIDSSHVAKMGGDIPFEYFEILPRLKKGVLIHIHDIFYPFLYPESWIKQGRCYNEAFILRALLMNSNAYEVCLFNDMLYKLHTDDYSKYCRSVGGSSIWLKKC